MKTAKTINYSLTNNADGTYTVKRRINGTICADTLPETLTLAEYVELCESGAGALDATPTYRDTKALRALKAAAEAVAEADEIDAVEPADAPESNEDEVCSVGSGDGMIPMSEVLGNIMAAIAPGGTPEPKPVDVPVDVPIDPIPEPEVKDTEADYSEVTDDVTDDSADDVTITPWTLTFQMAHKMLRAGEDVYHLEPDADGCAREMIIPSATREMYDAWINGSTIDAVNPTSKRVTLAKIYTYDPAAIPTNSDLAIAIHHSHARVATCEVQPITVAGARELQKEKDAPDICKYGNQLFAVHMVDRIESSIKGIKTAFAALKKYDGQNVLSQAIPRSFERFSTLCAEFIRTFAKYEEARESGNVDAKAIDQARIMSGRTFLAAINYLLKSAGIEKTVDMNGKVRTYMNYVGATSYATGRKAKVADDNKVGITATRKHVLNLVIDGIVTAAYLYLTGHRISLATVEDYEAEVAKCKAKADKVDAKYSKRVVVANAKAKAEVAA